MQALDLDIVNRLRVDLKSLGFLDEVGELLLLCMLDVNESAEHSLVVGVLFQTL